MNHQPNTGVPRSWWVRLITVTVVLAAGAFFAGGWIDDHLGGGGGPVASPAACKKALAANLQKAMENPGGPSMPEPAACVGLDDKTLDQIARDVASEGLMSPEAEKLFEDQWRKALESATATP